MLYVDPKMDVVRFATGDILADSNELPIIPAANDDEPEGFDKP